MKTDTDFEEFLNILSGQREVGLAIAKNEREIKNFVDVLWKEGFETSENIFDFYHFPKIYLVLEENIEKDFYDFIVQYSTGQVEIFDKEKNRPEIFSPNYEKNSVILVSTKDNLAKLRKKGFNALEIAGPAYQL